MAVYLTDIQGALHTRLNGQSPFNTGANHTPGLVLEDDDIQSKMEAMLNRVRVMAIVLRPISMVRVLEKTVVDFNWEVDCIETRQSTDQLEELISPQRQLLSRCLSFWTIIRFPVEPLREQIAPAPRQLCEWARRNQREAWSGIK
jgi:hypothetical protein